MVESILQWLNKESLKHPAMVLLLIMTASAGGGILVNPLVMASDFKVFQEATNKRFEQLENAVCQVQYSIQRSSADTQLRSVEMELYQLESIENPTARDRERLAKLKTDRESLKRNLDQMVTHSDCQ